MAETRRLKLTLECVVVNVGPSSRMTLTRNAKGKVTLTFAKGLREADRDAAEGLGVSKSPAGGPFPGPA
jgi:hypothetical protein